MIFRRVSIALLFIVSAASAMAGDTRVGDLVIMQPWARATIGQGKSGVAYLTVVNHGAGMDHLLGASTPAAKKAELHLSITEDGVMKMRHLEAIEIEAHASTALEPAGRHVMLMGLTAPLREGDAFPLTLTFETAGEVEVQVQVESATAREPDAGGTEMHGDHGAGHGD